MPTPTRSGAGSSGPTRGRRRARPSAGAARCPARGRGSTVPEADFVSEAVLEQTRCVDVSLSWACNARCRFCSQDPARRPHPGLAERDAARHIWAAWRDGYRRLGFSGGEPTVDPGLERLVALGRRAGFRSIRLQSNGLKLADADYAGLLVDRGLTTVRLSVHGAPSDHDALVGVLGAAALQRRAARVLRSLGCRLGVNMVLTRPALAGLEAGVAEWLREGGVTSFTLIYPRFEGAMAAEAAALAPSFSELAGPLERVMRLLEAEGLEPPLLLHFTPCLLPGYESRMLGWHRFDARVVEPDGRVSDLDESVAASKEFPERCAACAYRARCPGVDRAYLARFGAGEFAPRAARAPSRVRGPSVDPGRRLLTENELCVLRLLSGGALGTEAFLRRAERTPLCQDCRGGQSVTDAAERLVRMGRVRRTFRKGRYEWSAVPD
ncbi:radical SAM protein [bacterium]|nr:MAG: radical SAM protein [bacterium]